MLKSLGKKINLLYKKISLIELGIYRKIFKIKKINDKKLYICKSNFVDTNLCNKIEHLFSIVHPNLIFTKKIIFNKSFDQLHSITKYGNHNIRFILESGVNFSSNQIKCIIKQILYGINILHKNKIVHGDIKVDNFLFIKRFIKLCDFESFNKKKINFVKLKNTTLCYKSPELLLEKTKITTSTDMWCVGCVFAELVLSKNLFLSKTEHDHFCKILSLLGTPSLKSWKKIVLSDFKPFFRSFNNLKKKFKYHIDSYGLNLLNRFFTYQSSKRISAESALMHPFF